MIFNVSKAHPVSDWLSEGSWIHAEDGPCDSWTENNVSFSPHHESNEKKDISGKRSRSPSHWCDSQFPSSSHILRNCARFRFPTFIHKGPLLGLNSSQAWTLQKILHPGYSMIMVFQNLAQLGKICIFIEKQTNFEKKGKYLPCQILTIPYFCISLFFCQGRLQHRPPPGSDGKKTGGRVPACGPHGPTFTWNLRPADPIVCHFTVAFLPSSQTSESLRLPFPRRTPDSIPSCERFCHPVSCDSSTSLDGRPLRDALPAVV